MGSVLAKPFVGGVKGSCPLSEAQATNLLCTVKGWRIIKDDLGLKLQHDWRVKNLLAGMQLLQGVAMLASIEQHHPDLSLYQSNIARVEICSPLVGGLTENDFTLAAKIDGIYVSDLIVSRDDKFGIKL
ncbi:hypothetical protein CY35_19G020800 [Sphagnum magellanicum]|nr:hypothetical protein CY35_19G020800 [Sphagnum magellanicum]